MKDNNWTSPLLYNLFLSLIRKLSADKSPVKNQMNRFCSNVYVRQTASRNLYHFSLSRSHSWERWRKATDNLGATLVSIIAKTSTHLGPSVNAVDKYWEFPVNHPTCVQWQHSIWELNTYTPVIAQPTCRIPIFSFIPYVIQYTVDKYELV